MILDFHQAKYGMAEDTIIAISGSRDMPPGVWGLTSGNVIAVYPLESSGDSVAISAGNRFVVGTRNGQLHFLTLQNYP